jgi:hypothetical protein
MATFKKREANGELAERTLDVFKKIAVDILSQATPADQVANRLRWTSLEDLKRPQFGNPLGDPSDVSVLIHTRATRYVRCDNT